MGRKIQKKYLQENNRPADIDDLKKLSGRHEIKELKEIRMKLSMLLNSIDTPSVRFCHELHEIEKMAADKRKEGVSAQMTRKDVRLQAQAEEQQELAEAKKHAACT